MKEWVKGRDLPMDEELLQALPKIPEFSGCSVGLERLFMAVYNIESLDQIHGFLRRKAYEQPEGSPWYFTERTVCTIPCFQLVFAPCPRGQN
jgi:hypothetical protein